MLAQRYLSPAGGEALRRRHASATRSRFRARQDPREVCEYSRAVSLCCREIPLPAELHGHRHRRHMLVQVVVVVRLLRRISIVVGILHSTFASPVLSFLRLVSANILVL